MLQSLARFFGSGRLAVIGGDAFEQRDGFAFLIQLAVKITKVDGRPTPLFRFELVLEHFLVFKRRGQMILQILFVNFRDAQSNLLFARVLFENIAQPLDRLQKISVRPNLFGLLIFGGLEAFIDIQKSLRPARNEMSNVPAFV